jgi:hypothetical protein
MMLSDLFEARRYRSTSAAMGANSGPMSSFVLSDVNETKFGVGKRAITDGIIDFYPLASERGEIYSEHGHRTGGAAVRYAE